MKKWLVDALGVVIVAGLGTAAAATALACTGLDIGWGRFLPALLVLLIALYGAVQVGRTGQKQPWIFQGVCFAGLLALCALIPLSSVVGENPYRHTPPPAVVTPVAIIGSLLTAIAVLGAILLAHKDQNGARAAHGVVTVMMILGMTYWLVIGMSCTWS